MTAGQLKPPTTCCCLSTDTLAELAAPYTHIAGPIYEGRGVGVDVNASAYYFAGGALSWFSFPSIKVAQGPGSADESPGEGQSRPTQ